MTVLEIITKLRMLQVQLAENALEYGPIPNMNDVTFASRKAAFDAHKKDYHLVLALQSEIEEEESA